ncbi:putative alanine--tRNA ligase [Saccharomycopsis crataegensis]|uniref:Alanine--tRNA ligase n=1 Tax=Saccharomycopsis crataegensis TaxID=43959 RepID=A0AAV5QRW6_9ASCO|nr:putative alanine--tRNA ligase [Saccharomycopsis crataegensis]
MTSISQQFTSTVVGALACQRDSYLKTFKTIVVNCVEKTPEKPAKSKSKGKSKEKATSGDAPDISSLSLNDGKYYEVELEDTILFPMGGGQPSDTGSIIISDDKSIPVSFVRRDGLIARHQVLEPIAPGTPVSLLLDWHRRLDLMQQHTGQHLLSAILDSRQLPTLSWKMGSGTSVSELVNYLEIPRKLSDEEVTQITDEVNAKILENLPIGVEVPGAEDFSQHKTNKIPEDYDLSKGVLRVVHIGELDANTCCGTHLNSTGQVASISLLHQTHVRGTNSRLHFLCGGRVAQYSSGVHGVMRNVLSALSCQMDEVDEKLDGMSTQLRKALGANKSLLEELARLKEKELIEKIDKGQQVVFEHYCDKSLEFLMNFFKGLNAHYNKKIPQTVVLMCGEYKESGAIMIFGGESARVQEIAGELKSKIKSLKGGGKDKWQGKVGAFEKGEIESVKEYFMAKE